jgi:antitoxin VapB
MPNMIDFLQTTNSGRNPGTLETDPAMTLNIEDTETEKLAAEIAEMTGDTKTSAVREALREKKKRLEMRSGGGGKPKLGLREFFEKEIWPLLPEEALGQPPMSKEDEEALLGYDEGDGA